MQENINKRNGFVSACMWVGILGYLSITVLYIVTMYGESSHNTILGLGLCSMLALADALGILLLLRWSKNGFYLLVLSAALSAVVNLSVLRLDFLPALYFLIASAIWFVILQLRSGGKSVWSQLKNGWDSKHCRHIYQLFAIVEVILFVLTLIAYGNRSESTEGSTIQKDEQVKSEPQPLPTSPIKSVEDVDSTQESSTKTPTHNEVTPIKSEKESQKEIEKPSKNSDKESKPSKNDKQNNASFDMTEAAKYLDSHDVWDAKEMEKYADLKDLNKRIIESIRIGHSVIPKDLCYKSKRLGQIDRLLREYEHINIKKSSKLFPKVRIEYDGYDDKIRPNKIIMRIENAIKRKRKVKREIDAYDKLVSDEAKNAEPSFGLR